MDYPKRMPDQIFFVGFMEEDIEARLDAKRVKSDGLFRCQQLQKLKAKVTRILKVNSTAVNENAYHRY